MPETHSQLARRADFVAASYLLQRYSSPGNPMGTGVLRIGDLVATKVASAPNNELMNSVHGLLDGSLLPQLLEFYGATQQSFWIHTAPYTSVEVTDALITAGFRIERYAATLLATPVPSARPHNPDVVITRVGKNQINAFLDTLNSGFGSPPDVLDTLRKKQRFWSDVPSWRLFLAQIDGVPAGAAVLSVHEDAAYLAAASVLPAFRGRGVQSALLAARLAQAQALNCGTVCCGAEWGSQSHRNIQRAGLELSHIRTIWHNDRR